MIKFKVVEYKNIWLICLLTIVSLNANAQKLPGTQKVSLRAPADIKADGKATEWDGKFQAYNNATDVFYTIANDDKNLYLNISATDKGIIQKIISGAFLLP